MIEQIVGLVIAAGILPFGMWAMNQMSEIKWKDILDEDFKDYNKNLRDESQETRP